MRILIIGVRGQLGGWLQRELGSRHEVMGLDLPELDIRDPAAVDRVVDAERPDWVVLTAALTHVDRCEERPEEAEAINVGGTENVARACRRINSGMVFFSSDYVFDGSAGPYAEGDPTHPISVYGRTKLAGERLVADLVSKHLVVRTMVVYSYLSGSVNLCMQILERARRNEAITQPGDQWVNPTQAVNLAAAVAELLETGRTGLIHLAGTTRLTRDDFARRLVRRLGYDPELVKGILTSELRQKALRPLQSGLKTEKAQALLRVNSLWNLQTALDYTQQQIQDSRNWSTNA